MSYATAKRIGAIMHTGTTPGNLDTWTDTSKSKSGTIRAGTQISGGEPGGVFTFLSSHGVYTKTAWLSPSWYKPAAVVPPVEPPADDPTPPDFIEAHWVATGTVKRYVPE